MTCEQINLIRRSFDEMWPIRRNLAVKFYDRFFEACPDARRLFPSDMQKQHLKLMDTIAALVGTLDNRAVFQSIITHTARQHARFGVTSSQLNAFGDALTSSLEQQFGSAFTPELKQAWIALYEASRPTCYLLEKSKPDGRHYIHRPSTKRFPTLDLLALVDEEIA
jgi:hemoglobin-like flavoprotein